MGSCFARGIENAMLGKKFNVLSAAAEFDSFELALPGVTGRGFMNKYSTHSIRHELEWALDSDAEFPESSLVEGEDGTWIDPSTNPTLKWVCHEGTLRRRATISEVIRRIAKCRVIVFTLGLVELWYDNEAGIHLNMAPSPHMRSLHPGRYSFEVSNFIENRENMEAIGALLKKVGRSDLQIVVTTSPVPLMATFTNRDIVVANAYSKSVLRAVAEDFTASHDYAHYFPSYEIVMNSARKVAWSEDGRHVVPEVVHHIMRLFGENFVED
ncbi:MAG: GSCFA domain-containing protein [Planctomycetota bacterium]